MPARPIVVTEEDERDFQAAMDCYKEANGRPFPTWSEILEVLRTLGYAKRIWKPVGLWSPVERDAGEVDPIGPIGWYSSAETAVGP